MTELTLRLEGHEPAARALIHAAQTLADERRHREVEPLHLLAVLVDRDPSCRGAIERIGLTPTDVLVEAEHLLRRRPAGSGHALLSQAMLDLLSRAEGEAARHGGKSVSPQDLLISLATETHGGARDVIRALGLSAPVLRALLDVNVPPTPGTQASAEPARASATRDTNGVGSRPGAKAESGDPLALYTVDWVSLAKSEHFDPVIGREAETERVLQVLARRFENNPLLVGDRGVGKTAIVRGLALRIAAGTVPPFLRDRRLLALDYGALVAGATLRGQLEERTRGLLDAIRRDAGGVLLFVPDLGAFTGTGAGAGDLLAASLGRGELRALAVTTPERLRSFVDDHPALSARFVSVAVEATDADGTRAVLSAVAPRFASAHGLRIDDEALDAAARLARRYIPGVALPKSAVDLIDEAAARLRIRDEGPPVAERHVTAEDVAVAVASVTGVPVARMLEEEAKKLLRMEDELCERVVGQDRAVSAVTRAVRRARVGLRDGKRPIGSFLFLGPSGVGKTELAKALAEFLFDDEAALTRLDMSEFSEKHTVARLLGSPPGYVDSDQGGFLTEAVRRRPYSVILFDEMEKAHPEVFDILLQVLDDGRLTDSRGRVAHFQDAVILLTSNVGSEKVLGHEGPPEALRAIVDAALRARYRPEFLNRIDEILVFDPLSRETLGKIATIQLRGLEGLLGARGLSLRVTDAAKAHLVELGYDPAFGARPLRRAIQRELQDPLAHALLAGEFARGDVIEVGLDGRAFRFAKGSPTTS